MTLRRRSRSTSAPAGSPTMQERRRIGGGEQADLEGARVQRKHGDQRQRELRDLAADLAHGVRQEELAEVEVGEHPEPVAHGHADRVRERLGNVNHLFRAALAST